MNETGRLPTPPLSCLGGGVKRCVTTQGAWTQTWNADFRWWSGHALHGCWAASPPTDDGCGTRSATASVGKKITDENNR